MNIKKSGKMYKITRGEWGEGLRYDVQILHKFNNDYVYCGHGKFCKNIIDAIKFIREN